jgi:hypothetical protein
MTLDEVIPLGRSMREYELMFALTANDLKKNILGCADGPASFNAEMSWEGHNVISVDPIYAFDKFEIRNRFYDTLDFVIQQVSATPVDWSWKIHKDPEDLRRNRITVMECFVVDYELGKSQGRYRVGTLPNLQFGDKSFELALCSHFLFLYSNQLDINFHIEATKELCRVAEEVRIFPLLGLDCKPSPYLDSVREALRMAGMRSEIIEVEYEMQRGGNQMIRFFKRPY